MITLLQLQCHTKALIVTKCEVKTNKHGTADLQLKLSHKQKYGYCLFFVSSHRADLVDFERLRLAGAQRIVLLESAEKINKLPKNILEQFDRIIECNPKCGSVPYFTGLDFDDTKDKVIKELSTHDYSPLFNSFWEFDVDTALHLAILLSRNPQTERPYLYRLKNKMKDVVSKSGVRTPIYEDFNITLARSEPDLYFQQIKERVGIPFILKPIDSSGSVGVFKISNKEHFVDACKTVFTNDELHGVEEYIDGALYHCDFIISDKKIIYQGCGEYFHPCLDASLGKILGGIMFPPQHAVSKKTLEFARRCLKDFDIKSGAVHMEVFKKEHSGEYVFLELAMRPPGLPGQTSAIDVTLHTLSWLALFSTPPSPAYLEKDNASIWGQVPIKSSGKIRTLTLPTLASHAQIDFNVKIGDVIEGGLSYFKPLCVLAIPPQPIEDVISDFHSLKTHQFAELEK
jgi:hypothetical protein